MPKPIVCIWSVGSTDAATLKSSLPSACIKRGCAGFFSDGAVPTCDTFRKMTPLEAESRAAALMLQKKEE